MYFLQFKPFLNSSIYLVYRHNFVPSYSRRPYFISAFLFFYHTVTLYLLRTVVSPPFSCHHVPYLASCLIWGSPSRSGEMLGVYLLILTFDKYALFLLTSMLCSIDKYALFCILFASWHSPATLTEVFLSIFLSCKANARVHLAKKGHGPRSS